jgi:hypothetical protein
MDAETLYRQIGRLIESMPAIPAFGAMSTDANMWLGRVHALLNEPIVLDVAGKVELTMAMQNMQKGTRPLAFETIRTLLYRGLAAAEHIAPPGVQGAFIPVGNSFDTFAAIAKVLKSAAKDVLIVDPYMDDAPLTEFGGAVPDGITLRLLSDEAGHKQSLSPASKGWASQYGATRPLQVRLALPKSLHDRAIFIDQKTAWTLTQSLKDFAKRSPAEIVRADDTADLKIQAYEAIWQTSKTIVG